MTARTRKLIGLLMLLALVAAWVLLVASFAPLAFARVPPGLGFVVYAVAGLGWVLPAMPLIRWMQRPDRREV